MHNSRKLQLEQATLNDSGFIGGDIQAGSGELTLYASVNVIASNMAYPVRVINRIMRDCIFHCLMYIKEHTD